MRIDDRSISIFAVLVLCTSPAFWSPAPADDTQPDLELLVPYEPTHPQVVEAMLEVAAVCERDRVFDLGCGDGRIVIAAAKRAGTRGFGIDLDPQRIREATESARFAGVTDLVEFTVGDIMAADLRQASVVTLYLLDSVNLMVRPKLFRELAPGSRVVSHAFTMGEWDPDLVVRHSKARGGRIFYWVMPARAGGRWRWVANMAGEEGISAAVDLFQEFSALRGTLTLEGREPVELANVAIQGKELQFSAGISWGGQSLALSCRGLVDGEVIEGIVEYRGDGGSTRHPWIATRECVDLSGEWEVVPTVSADLRGVLTIHSSACGAHATYARASDDADPIRLDAFYAWGSSVRFEVPLAERTLVFRGTLDGDKGFGAVTAEESPDEERWWARRLSRSTVSPAWDEAMAARTPMVPAAPTFAVSPAHVESEARVAAAADEFSTGQVASAHGRFGAGRRTGRGRTWTVNMGPPQPGDEFTNPIDGSVLVWISGGTFTMGSDKGAEDERPANRVALGGFWLGKFEVTNRQYARFLEAGGDRAPPFWDDERYNRPELPVVGVTWLEARRYCEWAGLRMPTEAEWEYAASCGGEVAYGTATGDIGPDLANVQGVAGQDRWEFASPVGSFPPSCFGVYDLAGNAWEWTSSLFAPYPYSPNDGREDPKQLGLRVLRGGAWGLSPEYCRAVHRHRFARHLRYDYAGIRVAASLSDIVERAALHAAR